MLLLLCQVILTLSQQPLDTLRAVADRRGHIAIWRATACATAPATVSGGRILQEAESAGLSVMEPALVRVTVTRQRQTAGTKVARVIDSAAPLAAAITAALTDIPTWGKLAAPGVMVVQRLVRGRIDEVAAVPPGNWIDTESLAALPAGGCKSWLLLARFEGEQRPINRVLP